MVMQIHTGEFYYIGLTGDVLKEHWFYCLVTGPQVMSSFNSLNSCWFKTWRR